MEFSSCNDKARLEALQQYQILDTDPEAAFDDLAKLAAQVCAAPIAFITLVDEARQWFKSSVGAKVKEAPLNSGFCPFVIQTGETLVIPDTLADKQFATNPIVTGEPHVRFYAGTPLVTPEGYRLGTLCVIDSVARELTLAQLSGLEALGRQVATQLELRRTTRDNAQLYEAVKAAGQVREQVLQKMARTDAALLKVTRGVSRATGESFFYSLVQHLTQALNVQYAFIGELVPNNLEEIKTLAVCSTPNEIKDNFTYDLDNTPCREVIKKRKICCYSQGIHAEFPGNQFLVEWGIESYVAVPLLDAANNCVGLLGVMDTKPLEDIKLTKVLLPIFATRGAAELERQRVDKVLRDAVASFETLANTMPQIVWSTTSEGYHDYFNERWYEYTGMPRTGDRGWNWKDYLHPEDYEPTLPIWERSLETGEPYQVEYRFRRAVDGAYRWFIGRALPMYSQDGSIIRWFGTCTDIDDQKRAADERAALLESERVARSEAERASRLKDEFLLTLSHELRTPLNAILGWSQMLRRGKADAAKTAHGLDIIERNVRVQAQLIDDLLDMSRIISGKLRLNIQHVELGSVIEAAFETVRLSAEAKDIRLQKVIDPLAGIVLGDPARLQQIVWNLLSNAIKFTPKSGRVQVVLERVSSHVEISVIDTGQGIKLEFLPYVFERFRQADASTTRNHGGLGLGLAIVKHLTELHGGSVRAKSAGEGKGATFVVTLPLVVVHPQEVEPEDFGWETAKSAAVEYEEPTLNGLKVLVVDDEPDARALVKCILEERNAEVMTAGSAKEALKALSCERPDVLVSDIGMPQDDGYQLIRKVRALPPDQGGKIPAVALTAYARSEDRKQALLSGYQMHVAKPVEPSELIAVVASLKSLMQ